MELRECGQSWYPLLRTRLPAFAFAWEQGEGWSRWGSTAPLVGPPGPALPGAPQVQDCEAPSESRVLGSSSGYEGPGAQ